MYILLCDLSRSPITFMKLNLRQCLFSMATNVNEKDFKILELYNFHFLKYCQPIRESLNLLTTLLVTATLRFVSALEALSSTNEYRMNV